MLDEKIYTVVASIRNERGFLDTYPIPFPTLEEAQEEFNKQLNSGENWYALLIMHGDELVERVILDRKE